MSAYLVDFADVIINIIILFWLFYSIAVVIYLNILSYKYLQIKPQDHLVSNEELKSYSTLYEELKNKPSINVLVLSGGGIRGLVPLHILEYIEISTNKKIGELFDFFAGSSTGAISAAAFTITDKTGNYKFSAKEILSEYEKNAKQIFYAPWYHQFFTLFGIFAPRYIPDGKKLVLKRYFDKLTLADIKGNLLIPIYNVYSNSFKIIKSWVAQHGVNNKNFLLMDIIDGATSPPMLFPPTSFSLHGEGHMLIDPAVLLNNPSLHVLLYVKSIFPDKPINIVLLGNGEISDSSYDYKNIFSYGLYGFYQYLFNAPALSTVLYNEFIQDYILGSSTKELGVKFYFITSDFVNTVSVTNISEKNMRKLRAFSIKMLNENIDKIDDLINVLQESLVKK
jgi:hypothetical protein